MTHDPRRHTEYIQQSLRQDKTPIGFFLSAGCPLAIRVADGTGQSAPLIPDIAGMTAKVTQHLDSGEHAKAFTALKASMSQGADPNVEDLLSHVRMLAAIVGEATVHDLDAAALRGLESEITAEVVRLTSVDLPDSSTPYRDLASWAGAIPRSRPIEVFTTNYDLLIEQALEAVRTPYFDGFVGAHTPFFDIAAIEQDEIPPRWVRVWKLHGSINWRRGNTGAIARVAGPSSESSALIHPSHLKYEQSRRMPYLAMIDRLRAFLRQRGATLVICGYSFNDEHLNEVLVQGLEGNQTAAGFGLLFGSLDDYPLALSEAAKRPNLSLLAHDGAVIGTRREAWTTNSNADAGEGQSAAFALGDFAELGSLLAEMIGPRTPEDSNES